MQKYVDVMVREFSALDPSTPHGYKTRGEEAKRSPCSRCGRARQRDFHPAGEPARAPSLRGCLLHLTSDAGLNEKYIWAVNSEQQATPRRFPPPSTTCARTTFLPVLARSTVSDNPMRQVADATGARFGGVLYVDSLSDSSGPVPTYLT